jgi:hypothetical protein
MLMTADEATTAMVGAQEAVPRRIGIIVNPRSHAHARHRAEIAAAGADCVLGVPDTHAALAETLAGFRRRNVGLIVINGGDGTLRDVLTALPAAYPETLPELALLPAGNTNLAAWSHGGAWRGEAALQSLLAAVDAGEVRRTACPVLELRWIGQPDRPALRGLLFGAGAFPDAKRLADAQIHRRGLHRRRAVGLTLIVMFWRTLLGGGPLRKGTAMGFGTDGGRRLARDRFLVLATTLDRLTLGLWPFWGEGSGGIRWLDIDSPPQRLVAAVIAILRRRPRAWLAEAGYRSGRATRISLALTQDFVMDGEFFDAGSSGIELSAPFSVVFVHP